MLKKVSPVALALLPMAGALFFAQTTNPKVQSHVDKLQNAKGVTLEFTVQPIGESAVNHTLELSFPNKMRWDSPSKLVVMDGKTVWMLDKKSNTFTEEPAAANWLATHLTGSDAWLWAAFSDAKFGEQLGALKQGRSRKLRGVDIVEWETTLAKKGALPATLFWDEKLGLFRGAMTKVVADGKTTETLILAEKVEVGGTALADSKFAFAPPAGAKKAEAVAPAEGVKYSEVAQIFTANCTGCHGVGGRSAGLDLSTHAAIMRGGRGGPVVVAGNAAGSRLLMHMKGQRKVMPPSGSLPANVIAKVESWIAAGAKND